MGIIMYSMIKSDPSCIEKTASMCIVFSHGIFRFEILLKLKNGRFR